MYSRRHRRALPPRCRSKRRAAGAVVDDHRFEIFSAPATGRAARSAWPPAGNGTIMVMCALGALARMQIRQRGLRQRHHRGEFQVHVGSSAGFSLRVFGFADEA
jgi:hypothetical protein